MQTLQRREDQTISTFPVHIRNLPVHIRNLHVTAIGSHNVHKCGEPVSTRHRLDSNFINPGTPQLPPMVTGLRIERGWLAVALEDLEAARAEAATEGEAAISDIAMAKGRELLRSLAFRLEDRPLIGSTREGGIYLDFRTENRGGILFICEADGSGACFRNVGGTKSRGRWSDASEMLNGSDWFTHTKADPA